MKSFAVLGLGQFGTSVATTISNGDFELIAIDKNPSSVQSISRYVPHAAIADCTDETVLSDLGVKNCDIVVVAVGNEFETAILTTVTLKEMGIKKVIVKATNKRHADILYKVGADMVILPEVEMGVRVANSMTESDILDRINLSPDYSIVELTANRKLVGKTIAQLDLRKKFGITVLAIKRNDEIIVSPLPIEEMMEKDICVLLGSNTQIESFKNI